MEQKNYTEVLIDGTIYTLGGMEGEAYLQRVAAYLNEKISNIRQQGGFRKQSAEYQALMVELNIADDYFKEQERADLLAEQKAAMEKDAYSLKHELITIQMKLENDQAELGRLKKEHKAMSQTPQGRLQQDLEYANAEIAKAREESEAVKAEAKQQIAEAQKAAEDAVQAAKAEAEQVIAGIRAEAKAKIEAVSSQIEEYQIRMEELQQSEESAKAACEEARKDEEALKQAYLDARSEAEDAKQKVEKEWERAERLQHQYDAVKRELEQIKALKAAAAAYTGRPPR